MAGTDFHGAIHPWDSKRMPSRNTFQVKIKSTRKELCVHNPSNNVIRHIVKVVDDWEAIVNHSDRGMVAKLHLA